MIIHLVHTKLDADSQAKWDEAIDYSTLPQWDDCSKVLSRRCQYLETKDTNSYSEPTSVGRNNSRPGKSLSLAVTHGSCAFCQTLGHTIYKCKKFIDLNVVNRFNEVKRLGLCVNCLKTGHSVKTCKSSKCRSCSHPHHTLLHRFVATPTPSNQGFEPANNSPSDHTQVSTTLVNATAQIDTPDDSKAQVLLATAVVKVRDNCGRFHLARALLDSASQVNLVTENLAQKLLLRKDKINLNLSGVGGSNTQVKYKTSTIIKSRLNDFDMNLNMWIIPKITDVQPESKVNRAEWNIPTNLELADPQFNIPKKVDLLIGADQFLNMLSIGQIKLGQEFPTVQKTMLGWIVAGRYNASGSYANGYKAMLSTDNKDLDPTLDTIVQRFWQIEEVNPGQSSTLSEDQIQCESIFQNNVKRLENGRFMVKLPFKRSAENLGSSFNIALKRFTNLERRLDRNAELKLQYSTFLKEYLSANHMELVDNSDVPKLHYYMPHQCVLRPDKTTTKLRVVFDASCSTSSGVSLNDLLLAGPTVQDDLLSIVFRFRCHRWALTADISAMYRQILVYPEDRSFQYILWRDNSQDEIKTFRLNTVTYGTAAAPYLATRCLKQLADETVDTYPRTSNIIRHDFYVDDLITGGDTQEEIIEISQEADKILRSAQFTLRKWYSNSVEFLNQTPDEKKEQTIRINDWDVIKA